jgi:hypothetical protein
VKKQEEEKIDDKPDEEEKEDFDEKGPEEKDKEEEEDQEMLAMETYDLSTCLTIKIFDKGVMYDTLIGFSSLNFSSLLIKSEIE